MHAQEWYAMGRHGGCVELSKVIERKELLRGLSTPSDIEAKLKKYNINYTLGPFFKDRKGILKLEVPSENLAMMLVQKQFCDEIIKR